MWSNGIVPVAVEIITPQVDFSPLFVGDLATDGIPPTIQSAGDFQAGRRGRFRDQVHHRGIIGQRLTSPVQADEREEPVLNLVPFAGTRRKMADRDGETQFIGETLQLPFPQTQPRPMASPASAVISNRVAWGYARRPSARHHARIEATAKAAVSWSVPTLTKPLFRVSS